MTIQKKKLYNKMYPMQVWALTLAIGTILRTMTMQHWRIPPGGRSIFVNELILGVQYSVFTLAICYAVFLYLIKTEFHFISIKVLIAIIGMLTCTATILFKFNFSLHDAIERENLTLIACYCLPLMAGCFLFRIREYAYLH